MTFKDYWKEKAAKRRKGWASKFKRLSEEGGELEYFRNMAFSPLDYSGPFNFDNYKKAHYTMNNPIMQWRQMDFSFSESGLRAALEAEGAEMDSFKMVVSRRSIKGKQAPKSNNGWKTYPCMNPKKRDRYETMYRAWLKRVYEICTDVEIVHLTYGQVTMTIHRYSTEGMPFGYYELNPCEQLTEAYFLLHEADFYTLNTATLLMEAAAEWELRQDEFLYYAKRWKIRTMEAFTTDSIELKMWSEKKLQKKIPEYIAKGYNLDKIIEQVCRPWKVAIKKYIEAVTEREEQVPYSKFDPYHFNVEDFIKNPLRLFFDREGLREAKIWKSEGTCYDICMEFKGYQAGHNSIKRLFYPNTHYPMCGIPIPDWTPLIAIAEYLKAMPKLSQQLDETIATVHHIYDQLKQ